jgi:hypothetical protein
MIRTELLLVVKILQIQEKQTKVDSGETFLEQDSIIQQKRANK